MCITTNQPDTKSNRNLSPNLSTKQLAVVSIQLNNSNMLYLYCYPDQFIQDSVIAPILLPAVVVVTHLVGGMAQWLGRQSFPDMFLIYGSRVGKASAMGQPTRPTQPPTLSGTGNE